MTPLDCSPPGSSVQGISQARILEWVASHFSRGSSWPRDQTCVSCIGRRILYHWATRQAPTSDCISIFWSGMILSKFSLSCKLILKYQYSKEMPILSLKRSISDVEPVSCVCWPSVCLLWRNAYLGFLSIFFNKMVWFFDIELHQLFVYFGDYLMAIRTSETLCFRWGIFLLPGLPLSSLSRATNFHFLHIPRLSSGLSPFICLPSASWLSE